MTAALYIFTICFLLIIFACLAYVALLLRRKIAVVERKKHSLSRSPGNPIIAPLPYREWEAAGTFNPAAVEDDEGNVHLFYRAVGADGVSRIGHALSRDGLHIDERSMYPVYDPENYGHAPHAEEAAGPKTYDPTIYTSGGGWSGSEDPRAVRIGDRVYMSYVAFAGWESVRIAITSLPMKDLKKRRWNWKRPIMLSPARQVNKNWVIFPEKIHGKYAILHSISPEVRIDYVETLDVFYNNSPIKTVPPKGGRKGFWDNWVRGAGPPPIRTDKGWLLLYHAMDHADPNKYKLGAMLLDADNPAKVLYRSPQPILEPDMPYENNTKPGVVYASGAIIKNGDLYVYYGGGDHHVCVAETPLKGLLDWLVMYGKV